MERLQRQLFKAAATGNVSSLRQLRNEDPLLLERVTPYYNSETALHVSALLGHLDFVKEIIGIKSELTREMNSQHSSPLHLASAKGHADVVRELLSVVGHETTCLARDIDGLTPLHLAAIKGRVEVMELLLGAQPEAARLPLYGGETILHLCVKNWQVEALKLLVSSVGDPEFVKSKDGEGNTLLHLAVEYKQVETINVLVNNGTGAAQVDVNAVNNKGLTAMDVLNRSRSDVRDSEISESLNRGAGAGAGAGASSILADKRVDDKTWFMKHLQETTNALMVVASVIAAMASQIAVNPPGGVWQDDNYLFDSDGNTVDPLGNPISHAVDSQNRSVLYPHRAGYSILATNSPYAFTSLCNLNTAAFYSSVVIIFVVATGYYRYFFFECILMLASFFALITAMWTYNIAAVAWVPLTDEYEKNVVGADTYYIISPYIYFNAVLSLAAFCSLWALIRLYGGRCKAATSAVPENNNSVV